jgi:hypothetical protein
MLYHTYLRLYSGSFLDNSRCAQGKTQTGETAQFYKRRFSIPEDGTDYPPDKRSDSIQIDALKTYGN